MKEHLLDQYDNLGTAIEKLDEGLLNELLEDCYQTIQKGNKIVVSGLGKNVSVADKFVGSMLSLGLSANFLHTNSAVHGDLGMIKDGDLIIVLSKSGKTLESLNLAHQLEQRKVITWGISFEDDSELSKAVQKHLTLKIKHEELKWDLVPINSSLVYLTILQGLVLSLADKFDIQLEEFKKNHPGGNIGERLKQIES